MRVQFNDTWWRESQEHLKSLVENDTDKAFDNWMQYYCEALINWRLDICLKLTQEPYEFLLKFPLGESFFQEGTKAIISEEYDQALKMLDYLVDNGLKNQTDESIKLIYALVNIFIGRYYLYEYYDIFINKNQNYKKQAKSYFDRALSLAREDGRPYAALGSYFHEIGDQDQASNLFSLANEKSPNQPDGYVGMGLLAEEREKLMEAKDWYYKAISTIVEQRNIVDILNKLLVKGSESLYIQLAQFLQKKEDLNQALYAVNLALDLVKRQSINERTAYKIKGEILEELGSINEGAEAYHQAGKRYYWANEYDTAEELFYKVKDINKKHSDNYWYLADNLRLQAYKPEFPYVINDILQESLEIWDAGYNLKKPEMGWPYVARAVISERMGKIEKDKNACLWEAVAYIECALALNDKEPNWWATLIRIYLNLELNATALQTLFIPSKESEENVSFLDIQAIVFGDIGEYESALEIIEKRLDKEGDVLAYAITGYNKFYLDEYEKAKGILEDAIKKDPSLVPSNLWMLYYCAICYRRFDSIPEALKKFNEIWKYYEDNSEEYVKHEAYDEFIDVAFYLDGLRGDYNFLDYIFEMTNKQLNFEYKSQNSIFSSNLILGLAHLKNFDMEEGQKYLEDAVNTTRHKRHINYMSLLMLELEQQLDERLEKLEIYNNKEEASEIENNILQAKEKLDDIRDQLIERSTKFSYLSVLEKDEDDRIKAALGEIEKEFKKFKEEGKIGGYAWIGINATLVRWYETSKNWSIKLYNAYEELFKHRDMFPVFEGRLKSTINLLRDEGNSNLEEERLENALNLFEQAIELMKFDNNKSQDKIDLLSRIGFIYFQMKETIQAIETWTQATKIYKEIMPFSEINEKGNAGQFIGKICLSLLKHVEDCWKLIKIIEEHSKILQPIDSLIRDFKEMKILLIDFFDQYFQLKKEAAGSYEKNSVVTPILVEIGKDLVPMDEKNWNFINEYIPEMRKRIKECIGINFPGIRTRGNETDLSPNSYNILLNEISTQSGEVFSNKGYCLESPDTILKKYHRISWRDINRVSDPITGTTGCWIPNEYLDDLSNLGIKLWKDPMIFIVRHLEAIIYQNLDRFLGIQEVVNLLYDWEAEDGDEKSLLINTVLPDQKSKLKFAQILRNLVKEKVPITRMKEILKIVDEVNLIDDDIDKIIRRIRLNLKKNLPGNEESVERIGPIEEFEESLFEFLKYNLYKIPPESIANVLSIIRDYVNKNKMNQVLVIKKAELRPLAREIVQIEFPNHYVIAMEELI